MLCAGRFGGLMVRAAACLAARRAWGQGAAGLGAPLAVEGVEAFGAKGERGAGREPEAEVQEDHDACDLQARSAWPPNTHQTQINRTKHTRACFRG